jgi:methionyl aminopeptidase
MVISIKNQQEISAMRRAGKVVAEILQVLKNNVKPGTATRELNNIAEQELAHRGAQSSFKGYRGFPASICISINDEIVHGIPGERVIRDGDVVSLDFGAIVDGYHGDSALTVIAGSGNQKAKKLIQTTRESLEAGIDAAIAGARLGDISSTIQRYAESRGFGVVREYTGHGIGKAMHEEPLVPNFGKPGQGPELKPGMTFALEPMLTTGDWRTRVGKDGWVVSTADGSLAAHFEHTIVITGDKAQILTSLHPEKLPSSVLAKSSECF